jgi:hypothetical protein
MKTKPFTEADFLQQVAKHQMQIVHEAGELRHIQFKEPGTQNLHFNITTVPGYLMITGDMGAWTFTRLRDMFELFRAPERYGPGLHINLSYWAEKLTACDCGGHFPSKGAKEFDENKFAAILRRQGKELLREAKADGHDKGVRADMLEELRGLLSDIDRDNEHAAYRLADEWSYRAGQDTYRFSDLWDHDFKSYRHSFIWACYAIAWGIQQYDAAKDAANSAQQVAA